MHELRILFSKPEAGSYQVSLTDGQKQPVGVAVPFTPFLKEEDYADLRWYLEEYMELPDGGAVVRAQRIEGELTNWGHQLYDALFTVPENKTALSALLAAAEPRELTIATDDVNILRLPWELMADEAGHLALRVSVRRQLSEPEKLIPREVKLPLRILYIVSRPEDAGFIDPRVTTKALFAALDPLGANVQLDFCRPPTLAKMGEMLRAAQQSGKNYDVVHFDGHGTFLKDKGTGALAFEISDKDGWKTKNHHVEALQFSIFIEKFKVPLVVLDMCRGAQVGARTFGSIAARLVQFGVSNVLAMSHSVHVEAAKLFMNRFYRELLTGNTIGQAVTASRESLSNSPQRWMKWSPDAVHFGLQDWFLPHLYQRGLDYSLLPPGLEKEKASHRPVFRPPARQRDEHGSFPPLPQYGFHGRAKELLLLERALGVRRGIVLHAMGGMGKTSLATEAADWWTRSGLFPDGACFVSFEQFTNADRVVQVLGCYMHGDQFNRLSEVDQRARVIELFHQRDVLMVWDNYESVLPQFNDGNAAHGGPYDDEERARLGELFRELTTGHERGAVLVTCRPGRTGLPNAFPYELQGLARADSLWLLAEILQRHDLKLSDPRFTRDKLDPLLLDLGDHPLSLELVGPHLKTLTPETIRADFAKLITKFEQDAPLGADGQKGRNSSLLASLEFSKRHLSPPAQAALSWLGLFSGGVFEINLLAVSQIKPKDWEPIRRELQSTALVRVEDGLQIGGRPFIRFHPALASVALDGILADQLEIRQRFIQVYNAFRQLLKEAMAGTQSRAALEILDHEDANYRTAVRWTISDGLVSEAASLGDTFATYLQRSGRLSERDAWVTLLKDATQQGVFSEDAAHYERRDAWRRFRQGDPEGALEQLEGLIERLGSTTEFDPAFELALAIGHLCRMTAYSGSLSKAIPILKESIRLRAALFLKVSGQSWESLIDNGEHSKADAELANIAVALGDLANALCETGKLDEALEAAKRAIQIDENLDNKGEIAIGHGQCARILLEMGRIDEAEDRYERALKAARLAGDKEFESVTLMHQGGLAIQRQQFTRATSLVKQALEGCQAIGNMKGVMQCYMHLGIVDQRAGRLAEARAWYEKSRQMALDLEDQDGIAGVSHNIGTVCQQEGQAALDGGNEIAAKLSFQAAILSLKESLQVWQANENNPKTASTLSQLARVLFWVGNLEAAEQHVHQALQIHESLGSKEVWMDYGTLSAIAEARGDSEAAAEWARKSAVKYTGLELQTGDDEMGGIGLLEGLKHLAIACSQVHLGDQTLGADVEEALAQIDGLPEPLPAFATALRQLAGDELPAVPSELPAKLQELLEAVIQAVREAGA